MTDPRKAAEEYKPLTREGLREYFKQSRYRNENDNDYDPTNDRIDWHLETLITLFINTDHEAYKAGYAAAEQRWRKYPEEKPELMQEVLAQDIDGNFLGTESP
ncbi:MAG: hypothetical protein E6Q97_21540 [Desulfurellales bacterium]|nr:MAG: hypothetical protein E6Q97_21540 [Desulfurellales bacterium]